MDSSSFNSPSSNQNAAFNPRGVPICGCRESMRFYVSNSSENPGRRYWKCARFNSYDSCKLFVWDDKLGRDFPLAQSCSACKYSDLCIDAQTKRIERLKQKVVREKSKVNYLWAVVVVSWLIFFCFAMKTYSF